VSGFVGDDGRVHSPTGFNEPAVVLRGIHVGGPRTLATRLGHWPEMAAVALAVLALAGAAPMRRRRSGRGRRRRLRRNGERRPKATRGSGTRPRGHPDLQRGGEHRG
jgi:apolipoprotein N-acyltransferase